MTMKKSEAEKLWADLAGGFATIERIIPEIIKGRAWEPLGYATFTEAWADRLKGHRLATDFLRAAVVFQMFKEGLSDEDVIRTSGVADSRVKMLREQHELGIPPEAASTMVRAHTRSLPAAPFVVRIELEHHERVRFQELCGKLGYRLDAVAAEALRERMRALENATKRGA